MLTRIEIDGFKTFRDFALDLQPFNVIAGTNASGKSNLLDAIQLLSRLADTDLRSAVGGLRGEPGELFHRAPSGSVDERMRLAVEVLIEPDIRDPWGVERELIQTRLRYELVLERRRTGGFERLFVVHEAALRIGAGDDAWAKPFKRIGAEAITSRLGYGRRTDLLVTRADSGAPQFYISQDGVQGRTRPAAAAERTVLSTMTSAEFPHLFALRAELLSWRFLQLDPASLRSPADRHAPTQLEPSGANLAAVLARLKAATAQPDDPEGVLTDISAELSSLVPGVLGVRVREEEAENQWQVVIATRDAGEYSSRVASDGTLRVLALLTALSDPEFGGLVCFEEPENGVHPARLGPLIEHLRALVDVSATGTEGRLPLLQLILTTHSPVVVNALQSEREGIFFESATRIDGAAGTVDVVTHARPVLRFYQQTLDPDDIGRFATHGEVEQYLATASVR